MVLYVPCALSFISIQFLDLNLDDWFGVLSTKFIIFDIPLLYYYINIRSSIIFCLSSWDICLSLGISLSCPFITLSELFCSELFENFVIISATSLLRKLLVGCAFFRIALSEVVLNASVIDCLAWPRNFWLYLLLKFLLIFLPITLPLFLGKDKNL